MNTIFSVFHKDFYTPKNKLIKPIVVGKNVCAGVPGAVRDNTGENISLLNPHYCELTAMFWIWKNFKQGDQDIVGLVHYRRYFYNHSWLFSKVARLLRKFKLGSYNEYFISSEKEVIEILKSKKIIVPKIELCTLGHEPLSIKEEYQTSHIATDWPLIKEAISENCPEYLNIFDDFGNGKYLFNCNMFITTRKEFDKYCSWLYPLLQKFYSRTEISTDPYQARAVGFIAERLLNVYVLRNFAKDEVAYLEKSFIDWE